MVYADDSAISNGLHVQPPALHGRRTTYGVRFSFPGVCMVNEPTVWRCDSCRRPFGQVYDGYLTMVHHCRTIRIRLPVAVIVVCDRCGAVNEWVAESYEVEQADE